MICRAYFTDGCIFECYNFAHLYRMTLLTITGEAYHGHLVSAELEVDGLPVCNLVPRHWKFAQDEWYTIDLCRYRDGKIYTVRHCNMV